MILDQNFVTTMKQDQDNIENLFDKKEQAALLERLTDNTHTKEDAQLIRRALEVVELLSKNEVPGISLSGKLRAELFKDDQEN